MKENKYDFFVSHASEDKNDFVRPLAEELANRGFKIWYDEFSLEIGDSLAQGISKGIKESLYGIIVLSKNFFEKKWTKKELEALLNKEVIVDRSLILPIWLDISPEDVYNFSPLLIDKLAITVKKGETTKAIEAIEKKSGISITSLEDIQSKIKYLIECNDDRRNKYFIDLEYRIKSIFHFQEEHYNWHTSGELFKNDDDWDDVLVDLKGKELQAEYNIPNGVWVVTEPFPWNEIKRAIKLCSKWVFRKLNYQEALELHFLLEEYLDTDLNYILYGFPHSSIRTKEVDLVSMRGVMEIGIKNPKFRETNEDKHKKSYSKIFNKYF